MIAISPSPSYHDNPGGSLWTISADVSNIVIDDDQFGPYKSMGNGWHFIVIFSWVAKSAILWIIHLATLKKIASLAIAQSHGDVIKWNHFPRYWPFVWGSLVSSPNKGQWRGALMFSLICAWISDWVNNLAAGDLRCHHAHYDVIVMVWITSIDIKSTQHAIYLQLLVWYCEYVNTKHQMYLSLNILLSFKSQLRYWSRNITYRINR